MDVAVDVVVHMCRSEFPVSLEVGRSTVADLKSYLHRYLRDWEHDSRSSFGRDLARDFAVVDKLAVLLMDDV
jgi:orotate phosphoribosyltransferase-like protein